jgi:hypothetical protein
VTENRSWPEAHDSSQEMAMLRKPLPAYREDVSVHAAQPTRTDPGGYGIVTEAQLHELGSRHNAVLASGERRQPPISPRFSTFISNHPRRAESLWSHPLIARR